MRKHFWWLVGWLLLLLPAVTFANSARRSYFRATRLFKKKQWSEAQKVFEKTLTLVKKLPSRSKKQRLFRSLGIADISYHLARIHQEQNQAPKACLQLQDLIKQIKTIKTTWPRWRRQRINLLLPGRFRDAQKRFGQCGSVPASITIAELPPGASVFVETPGANGAKAQWTQVKPTFTTQATSVKVQVRAKGFITRTKTIQVARWKPQSFGFTLKKKPKPRVRPRIRERPRVVIVRPPPRRPPPPVPVYKKGWFWAVVGTGVAVVAAGVTIGVVAATQGKKITPATPKPGDIFPGTNP